MFVVGEILFLETTVPMRYAGQCKLLLLEFNLLFKNSNFSSFDSLRIIQLNYHVV